MLALLLALAAAPPLPPFPTEVRPRDATTAPANAALFALGDPAPAADTIGVAVTVGGAPVGANLDTVSCCVARARLGAPPAVGDVVGVNLTSPSGDVSWTWTAGPVDNAAPTITVAPSLLQHGVSGGVYDVVIGLEATDNTQIGMIIATDEGDVVGATVDGYLLRARLAADLAPGERCLSIVAVDVAENESAPSELCFTVEPPAEGEGEGEPPMGCASTTPSAIPWALALLLALMRRRAKLHSPQGQALGLPTELGSASLSFSRRRLRWLLDERCAREGRRRGASHQARRTDEVVNALILREAAWTVQRK